MIVVIIKGTTIEIIKEMIEEMTNEITNDERSLVENNNDNYKGVEQ